RQKHHATSTHARRDQRECRNLPPTNFQAARSRKDDHRLQLSLDGHDGFGRFYATRWTRHGETDSRTRRLCTTVGGEQTAGAARGDVSAGDGIRLGCAGSGRRAWWNGSKVQPADGPESAKRVWAGVAGGDDHAAVGRN